MIAPDALLIMAYIATLVNADLVKAVAVVVVVVVVDVVFHLMTACVGFKYGFIVRPSTFRAAFHRSLSMSQIVDRSFVVGMVVLLHLD